MPLPLEGIRIVEMGQLLAIPHLVKLLADMGAQVIRVESCVRIDPHRTTVFYQNQPGQHSWNRAANFYDQNRNKLGLTLDLTKPQGQQAMKDLIGISDIFAENFTPRVLKNFGLEYQDLRQIKPDLIMIASTGYGYYGPWANYGAVGPTTEAASGLAHLTGYADGGPALPEIPYTDYVGAEHGLFAVMAALHYRARTGKGQFIDLSQAQTSSAIIPEALMDYTVNGRIQQRMGNRHPVMAPHGCYPCQGNDKWITIAVSTDEQWQALGRVLCPHGDSCWCRDARFADGLSRWHHREELDEVLARCTSTWDHYQLMDALQGEGVPAGAVLTNKELLFDPHLKERRFYEVSEHDPSTGIPPLPYPGKPWKMSETPGSARQPAATLGEHNRFVLGELLARPEETLRALEAEGVIGFEPLNPRTPVPVPLEELQRQGRIEEYDEEFEERVRREYGL